VSYTPVLRQAFLVVGETVLDELGNAIGAIDRPHCLVTYTERDANGMVWRSGNLVLGPKDDQFAFSSFDVLPGSVAHFRTFVEGDPTCLTEARW
jgi:hypothetical protein